MDMMAPFSQILVVKESGGSRGIAVLQITTDILTQSRYGRYENSFEQEKWRVEIGRAHV